MCMKYKGVNYSYAFTFKIPLKDSGDREFNIAISNYRPDSKDFSGLCLENELRVISEKKMLFAAFFDIVNRTINITFESEKNILKKHPEFPPTPLMNARNTDFHKQFDIYKQDKKSLEYYEKLRIWFENRDSSQKEEPVDLKQLFICQTMVDFKVLISEEKKFQIKDTGFFTL